MLVVFYVVVDDFFEGVCIVFYVLIWCDGVFDFVVLIVVEWIFIFCVFE